VPAAVDAALSTFRRVLDGISGSNSSSSSSSCLLVRCSAWGVVLHISSMSSIAPAAAAAARALLQHAMLGRHSDVARIRCCVCFSKAACSSSAGTAAGLQCVCCAASSGGTAEPARTPTAGLKMLWHATLCWCMRTLRWGPCLLLRFGLLMLLFVCTKLEHKLQAVV
jgi:hypothetical protein